MLGSNNEKIWIHAFFKPSPFQAVSSAEMNRPSAHDSELFGVFGSAQKPTIYLELENYTTNYFFIKLFLWPYNVFSGVFDTI